MDKDLTSGWMLEVLQWVSFPELRRDHYEAWCHVVFNISDPDTWLPGKQRIILDYIDQYQEEIKANPSQWQFNILSSFFDIRARSNLYVSVDLGRMRGKVKSMSNEECVKYFSHIDPDIVEKFKFIVDGRWTVEFIQVK